jgi:hypothetical protein
MIDLERYWSGHRRVTAGGIARAIERLDDSGQLELAEGVSPHKAAELLINELREIGQAGFVEEPAPARLFLGDLASPVEGEGR